MKRLVMVFAVGAIVAALVPSAALAGKPVATHITSITVTSLGASTTTTGACSVTVSATWTGRGVATVGFDQWWAINVLNASGLVTATRTQTSADYTFTSVPLNSFLDWQVQLFNGRDRVIDSQTTPQTAAYADFDSTGLCPSAGTSIFSLNY